ncbi:condensation domain-containing protein [Rhizohabitans arisaemae]|uniref:condensation domain-containing protein n=1 Tax=Rhizohabitans arisaemae TaxID=2720610 RepID=UPI0024B17C9A|nr:condensation domain-containing protein [Rhizohabitans arisaemae]
MTAGTEPIGFDREQVAELIAEMEAAGISLWEDAGELRFHARRDALTPERRAALAEAKRLILAHLRAGSTLSIRPTPDARFEPFPLTDGQLAYLLGRHDMFGYGGAACHTYLEVRHADLQPARVQAAWRTLIRRHDMLRAVIYPDGRQRVLPEAPDYEIPVVDLRGTGPAEIQAAIVGAIREEMTRTVYPAGAWPLFELRITRTDDGAFLHISVDLLIADLTSVRLLLAELQRLYEDPATEPPPPPVTFRDYVLALRAQRETPKYDRDRDHWLARVDRFPLRPELPTLGTDQGSEVRFHRITGVLPREEWAALCRTAARRGVTPSQTVLAAYAETIGRWSRRPGFTLALTLPNRPLLHPVHPGIELVVGNFTTFNLLVVDTTPEATFETRAQALADRLRDDLERHEYTGIEVIRELTRRRGRDAGLMPVVFTDAIGLEDDRCEPTHGLGQPPQVWIDCQVRDHQGALRIDWDVREGVFPAGLVDDMFHVFTTFLSELTQETPWSEHSPMNTPAGRPSDDPPHEDTPTAEPSPEPVEEEPQDELERRLTRLWAELLDRPHVSRNQDFFALGGDSLLIWRLAGLVHAEFHQTHDLDQESLVRRLVRRPTVAALASHLRQPSARSSTRTPVRSLTRLADGEGVPRVLIHDASGTLTPYRALVPALTGPILGFEIDDALPYLELDPTLAAESVADSYARLLHDEPGDRFHLIGYGMGGLIATELARRLIETGATVESLTVISSARLPYQVDDELLIEYGFAQTAGANPTALGYPDERDLALTLRAVLAASPGIIGGGSLALLNTDVGRRFSDLAGWSQQERLASIAQAVGRAPEQIELDYRVFRQSFKAVTRYEPAPYPGDITLLRQHGTTSPIPTLQDDAAAFWRSLCLGHLTVIDIPGNHFTCLTPPHAETIARHLNHV